VKRYATIQVELDCGDDVMPSDDVLSAHIEDNIAGLVIWSGKAKMLGDRLHQPTVAIDMAEVKLGEVVSA